MVDALFLYLLMKSTCLTISFISSLLRGSVMKFWLLTATSVFSLHQSVKQQTTRAKRVQIEGLTTCYCVIMRIMDRKVLKATCNLLRILSPSVIYFLPLPSPNFCKKSKIRFLL